MPEHLHKRCLGGSTVTAQISETALSRRCSSTDHPSTTSPCLILSLHKQNLAREELLYSHSPMLRANATGIVHLRLHLFVFIVVSLLHPVPAFCLSLSTPLWLWSATTELSQKKLLWSVLYIPGGSPCGVQKFSTESKDKELAQTVRKAWESC